MAKDARQEAPKRRHSATYATDKRSGGYLVRVIGPDASRFVGREVPVTTKDGKEHMEKLERLIWAGPDKDPQTGQPTGKNAALYKFVAKPREAQDAEF